MASSKLLQYRRKAKPSRSPAGGWFGEGSLLKHEARRYDAIAIRDSQIALMPRATFDWLLASSIGFNGYLLRQLEVAGLVRVEYGAITILDPARLASYEG
jgi:CRP-like cAMP-binding protein